MSLDIQVSYVRLLVGDNRAPFTYTDAQIRAAIKLRNPRTADPIELRLAGAACAVQYPSDVSGGPFTGPF